MGRQLWIAQRLREYGLNVVEIDGWQTRGSEAFTPYGVVCHHTAGSPVGEIPSLRVLINGRAGLSGPLCNVGLGRSGTAYVIAAGRANHAGAGGWHGLVGNSSVLGIEAEDDGDGIWTQEQLDVYPRVAAALESGCATPDFSLICGHKEWAPTRKIDPRGINMDVLRLNAQAYNPHPPPPSPGADLTERLHVNAPVLSQGSTDRHHVGIMQNLLCWHAKDAVAYVMGGFDKVDAFPDGSFGPKTQGVLVEWQRRTNALRTDGVCDGDVWAWLCGV